MRLFPRKALAAAALAAVLGVATVAALSLHGRAEPEQARPPRPPVAVRVATAARADVPVTLTGLGAVQAHATVTIHARVDGELEAVAFREGEAVRAGAVLARLDARPFQAALDQALARKASDQAQLANAQANLQRFESLAQRDYAPRQQLDNQRALVQQLQATIAGDQAQIDLARTQLSYTTIAAPIDGVAGIRQVDPGNVVHASDPGGIVVIAQVQPIAVIFNLPAAELAEIRAAMAAATLSVAAQASRPGQPAAMGRLEVVDNTVDPATGTVRLKAVFDNADMALWPGEHVTVALLLRTDRAVVTVPAGAVERGPAGAFVYVVRPDQTVAQTPVEVARLAGERAVIARGVDAGAAVVVEGQYRLSPGARVAVAAAAAAAPAPQAQEQGQAPERAPAPAATP